MYAAYKFSHFAINLPKLNLSQFDEVLTETKMHSFLRHGVVFAPWCYAQARPMPSCGVRLSVCLFVCPSRSCILSKRVNIFSNIFYRRVATSIYSVSKKTGPLRLIQHNVTNSQRSLIIFDLIQFSIHCAKNFLNCLNWLGTSWVVFITTVATWVSEWVSEWVCSLLAAHQHKKAI